VLTRLRHDLLTATIEPGERLRLMVLRGRYDAGLTPLREALFQLAAEGLVTVEDQRGFRAAPVSRDDLNDLTEQRVLLEGRALALSVQRGDLGWESAVVAAHHRLAGTTMLVPGSSTLTPAWIEAHRSFHAALVAECGSAWLLRLCETLSDHAERYRRWSVRNEAGRDVAGEHAGLADAALSRDTELAVLRLADHYRRTAELCDLP
jgi:DNA-binding GntR family transcriptional regulator